jgi:hypothetical protein
VTYRCRSPKRAAKKIDARRQQRGPDATVVEHERLDEVIEMALVIRDVHHLAAGRGGLGLLDVLRHPAHFSQDGIERMLQRAIETIPLRRP